MFAYAYFRCTIDLSLLSKEQTHKLDLPLEEGEGVLVLLVTLTASAAVSISDLSVNMLDDPHERHQIIQRYVSLFLKCKLPRVFDFGFGLCGANYFQKKEHGA